MQHVYKHLHEIYQINLNTNFVLKLSFQLLNEVSGMMFDFMRTFTLIKVRVNYDHQILFTIHRKF